MKIVVRRRDDDGEATVGALLIDAEWACDTLEDQHQDVKVPGETRIPAGLYELELKPLGSSRFDDSCTRKLGEGHKGMLRVKDVPGFSEILVHVLNRETETDGCIGVGLGVSKDENGRYMILRSWDAYRKIYPPVAEALLAGERVTIEIIDGDRS